MVRAYGEVVRTRITRPPIALLGVFIIVLLLNGATQARERFISKPQETLKSEQRLEAEQLLTNLGYWTGPVDGTLDSQFRHALTAFQKVEDRARTGKLTLQELNSLRLAIKPLPLHVGFAHIEIDLRRQVLFVVDSNDSITRILPISSGNEGTYVDHGQVHRALTPTGRFKVLRQIRGWRLSTLGLLYYPNYIHEGFAVHGSPSVPAYPASHGCIRVPMFAAKELSTLMPVGTEVIVYRS